MLRRWSGQNRLALGLLTGMVLLVSWLAFKAVTLEPLTETGALSLAASDVLPLPEIDTEEIEEVRGLVLRSVARNPFRPDRSRPAGRYGAIAISEPHPPALPEPQPPPTPPPLRVVGIAVYERGGGLAALEAAGHPPRVLRVGEEIMGFRLLSIAAEEVRLRGQDTLLVLRLPSHP